MWQPESVVVVVDRVGRSFWVRRGQTRGRCAIVEGLERRTLLAAEITVFAPSNFNVTDGQTVDMNPLIGPVVQLPGRLVQATFSIRNDGDQTLSLGPPIVTGDFTVVSTPGTSVVPGGTASLVLGLNTSSAGTRTGTVSIPNNDPDENPFNMQLNVDVIPAGPDIVVQTDSTNVVSGATTVDFGSVAQGQTGPSRTFTVSNNGANNLILGAVSVPAGFTVTKQLPSGLGPGSQDTLTVQMNSGIAGTRTGVIRIPTNDPDENPFEIKVTGTVTNASPAEIAVRNGSTDLVNGTTTVNFGTVNLGQAPPTRSLIVTNEGGSNLTLGTVVVPNGFTIVDPLGVQLSPGASDTLTVQMNTAALGNRSGTIVIPNSDSNENPFRIPVSGTVVSGGVTTGPVIAVESDSTQLVSGATPVDFGSVPQGETGSVRTFTVTNTGTQVLQLGPVTVPNGFLVTEGLSTSLNPGASDSFMVQLDTSTAGTKTGTIQIPNNDPGQNPFSIPVTGMVTSGPSVGPEIVVRNGTTELIDGTTTVDFGLVQVGATAPVRTFTVSNVGTAALTVGTVSVPTGYTVTKALGSSIAAGGSDTLVVQMDATTAGSRSGTISIQNGDGDENPFDIPVTGTVSSSGTVTGPEVGVQVDGQSVRDGASVVNFGSVVLGEPGPTRTFRVTNQGTETLTLGAVSVPDGFTLTDGLSASLAPGTSDTFTVRMESAVLGEKHGIVSFASNDPNENPFEFTVTGTVVSSSEAPVPEPEIAVTVGTRDLVDGSSVVSFGSVVPGQFGPTRTFTVTNQGAASLALGTVSVPVGYTLTEGLTNLLAPGESDTFTVQLDSAVSGFKFGSIVIGNNDPDENPFEIAVTGQVLDSTTPVPTPGPVPPGPGPVPTGEAEVTVQRGTRDVVGGETMIRFGKVARGSQAAVRTFRVTNSGDGVLTLGRVRLPNTFELVEGLKSSLAPGESDTFTVRMRSESAGRKWGRIRIATNDGDENPFVIRVSGRVRGAAPAASAASASSNVSGASKAVVSPFSQTFSQKHIDEDLLS